MLELAHGANHPRQHHVLAGRGIDTGGQKLGGGEHDGRGAVHVLKPVEVAAPDVAFVGGDAAHIVGILPDEVGIEIGNATPHFVGVFLIDAKDDGFGEAVGLLEELGQVAGDGFRPGTQRDRLLEILGLVFIVRDGAAVAVQFILARPPAGRVPLADDPVDAVGGEETILDSLPQRILIDRVAEVEVGVAVVLPQRCCRHAKLEGGLEPLEDFPPVGIVAGAAPVALVHDHQVKEVAGKLLVQGGAIGVARESLIDGEIHLAPFHDLPRLDLVASVAERCEDAVLGLVHQDVPVGEVQDFWPPVLARAVPPGIPEFPADLERDSGFTRPGGHGEELPQDSLQDAFHGPVDGNLRVVSLPLLDGGVDRREQLLGGSVVLDATASPVSRPQFLGGRKGSQHGFLAGKVVKLDDLVAIGGVGKHQPEHLGIFLGLLQSVTCGLPGPLGFRHTKRETALVAKEVVGPLGRLADETLADRDDPAVRDGPLLGNAVRIGIPTGSLEGGDDELPAGIGFGHGHCGGVAGIRRSGKGHPVPARMQTNVKTQIGARDGGPVSKR